PAARPLFDPPPKTEAYRKFEKELNSREQKLQDFLRSKHQEVVGSAKRRVAEYLLAAHALHGKPSTGEFMLLADGGDLNPTMIIRWQSYLEQTRKSHHPVFALWHTLAALPESSFSNQAYDVIRKAGSRDQVADPINPIILRAIADKPPKALNELAQRYGEV